MYICLDCGKVFSEPKHWVETHGLSHGPYEEFNGCPTCGGAYAKALKCSCCGEWIRGEYVKTTEGERYCDGCYCHYTIGEE